MALEPKDVLSIFAAAPPRCSGCGAPMVVWSIPDEQHSILFHILFRCASPQCETSRTVEITKNNDGYDGKWLEER